MLKRDCQGTNRGSQENDRASEGWKNVVKNRVLKQWDNGGKVGATWMIQLYSHPQSSQPALYGLNMLIRLWSLNTSLGVLLIYSL